MPIYSHARRSVNQRAVPIEAVIPSARLVRPDLIFGPLQGALLQVGKADWLQAEGTQTLRHAWAREGRELGLIVVARHHGSELRGPSPRRMEVELRDPRGHLVEQAEDEGFVETSRIAEAKQRVIVAKARMPDPMAHELQPGRKRRRRKPLADAWSPSAARPGFERQPYEASPEAGGERQHDAEYGRVQMHVIMGIDVVEGDAGGSKGIELRPD